MPFEIVRNDITAMQVDAIVNPANPNPTIGYGCDAGIHQAAGPELLQARKQIGKIGVGEVKATHGFGLPAAYVFHAVGPVWQGGSHQEEQLLHQCYDRALNLALEMNCTSIAFPLLSAGNYGFPSTKALQIAIQAISSFLLEHELQIYLVVFHKEAFALSEKLFHSVSSYIDEHYIRDKSLDEYGIRKPAYSAQMPSISQRREISERKKQRMQEALLDLSIGGPAAPTEENVAAAGEDLSVRLKKADAGFSERLLDLIDQTGKKDSEIYKKANVDRKLFSKIRNNPHYQPSKVTALAFALALELNLEETKELIGRAGFALTHSSKFDIIVEYFIQEKNYNVFELNEVLFTFDQPLIGA